MNRSPHEGVVFAVLGPSILVASAWWLVRTIRFRRHAARAPGVVIGTDLSGGRYGTESSPIFRFQTPDTREWTVESIVSTRPPAFRIGDRVTVLYDPAQPEKARIDSITQLWLLPISGILVGISFSAIAYFDLHR